MNMHETHPLFQTYPLNDNQTISTGAVPVPYHVYDGFGILIGGTASLSAVEHLLADQQLRPIATSAGRALMGIWLCDFTAASLGPHNELQLSVLVTHQAAAPVDPVPDHPFALLKTLFVEESARMYCHRLWNDTETVVAYNRELLGLPAALNVGGIRRAQGVKRFEFHNEEGELLLEGAVQDIKRPSLRTALTLLRYFGLRASLESARNPILEARVVNPRGIQFDQNLDARSFLAADAPPVAFFDPAVDQLSLGPGVQSDLDFRPTFVEHFEPFRFVYLRPELPR